MAEASVPVLRGEEATPCPSVLELEELLRAGKVSCSHVDEVWPNLYIGDAQGPGALCGWGEPLGHAGPGLPHAAPAAVPAPGSDHREATPMGLPQPRLPPPALPAGPAAAGHRPELRGQSWSLLPATGLGHFVSLALALLVLLEALAQAETRKMVRAQCAVCPRACYPICFLLLPALHVGYCLQSPQQQHQVCGDRELEADSTKCPSEKNTAWARYPHSMDSLQKQDLRRPKIHGAVRGSPYQPPTLAYLQRLLWVRRAAMLSHINEVWPNLFLGDAYAARDKSKLVQLGITHVVNVAAGKFQVDTGAKFYRGMPLEYYGIEADDNPFFDLSVYFLPVAQYIRTALSVPQGRVLVHCAMGVSRSATVVLAFLMICENMTLVEAIRTVQAHRDICPNSGFLRQLQVLDNRLGRETGRL
ncbi:serine/threonine/tyrosine-interacting-like protein 2 isoform X1 [Mustela lutreola]|uniref:serine/threonine/tyrosine-interacting-like protein 2 isoform X1 n=1 Tax=Mustela lutreola TaxID=9666 RepID=UPI002796FCA9|nr:serine/threonine/tyrosine-interacting-like protein 2 isoform X1 [Mustela lutreola]XP_059025812.1 serine/threonine/tyrosine-interacting-like protein 2 isoform X1 [Mustela lutreola]